MNIVKVAPLLVLLLLGSIQPARATAGEFQ